MSVVVLLIAAINLGNLILAHLAARNQGIAVCLAIGCSRIDIVMQVVCETIILVIGGTGAGLAIALCISGSVRAIVPELSGTGRLIDFRVVAWTTAMAAIAGLGAAILPAVRVARSDSVRQLRVRSSTSDGGRLGVRKGIVIAQIALAFSLTVAAGLFARSLHRIDSLDLGFRTNGILVGTLTGSQAPDREAEASSLLVGVLNRVDALPGVLSASLALTTPVDAGISWPFSVPDAVSPVGPAQRRLVRLNAVTPTYFATMGIHLLQGRSFLESDNVHTRPVAVINEAAARAFWPEGQALGKCIQLDASSAQASVEDACAEIVGVVANTRGLIRQGDPQLEYYAAFSQLNHFPVRASPIVIVRAKFEPEALVGPVRQAMQTIDSSSFATVRSLDEMLDPQRRPWRLGTAVFASLALCALALTGLGLYAVMAYGVVLRSRELGIRLAIGAPPASVLQSVVVRGLGTALWGASIGTPIALLLERVLRSVLFGVEGEDVPTLALATLVVLLISVVASYLPARRASRMDPRTVLQG
jgi:putative ABC transport system permease protein